MPDINLLKDTAPGQSRPNQPKKTPAAAVKYSSPGPGTDSAPSQLKKPSGLGLWFRSLFRRRSPKKPQQQRPQPIKPKFSWPSAAVVRPSASSPEPEDIFADISKTNGGPQVSKPPNQEPNTPRGLKPGEFSPLPKIPPWTGPAPSHTAPVPSQPRVAASQSAQPRQTTTPGNQISAVPNHKKGFPGLGGIKIPSLHHQARKRWSEESAGVNLLPEELVTTFDPKKKLTTLGLVALATALVIGIVDVSLLLWKETQVQKTEEKRGEVAQVLAQIKALEKEQRQAIALKSSNEVIRQLLNRHVYWTKFLDKFERYTFPNVFYPSGINISLDGAVSMVGNAPDLETILQQKAVYTQAKDFIKSVKIDTISRAGEGAAGYTFVADFTFVSDAFYQPIDQVSAATSPSGGTDQVTVSP